MAMLILLGLAGLPLLGIVYIIFFGAPLTVDGLFMSLILLAMSGIMGTTALFELRKGKGMLLAPARPSTRSVPGRVVQSGKVEDVVFFESNVGQSNKSIVTLSDGGQAAPRTLVVEGDMRNALPIGRTVHIVLRKEGGENVLADVSYS